MVGGFVLRPWFDKLEAEGLISYESGVNRWNLIRIKKNFVEQFPQLKEKRSKFSYKMTFYPSYEQLRKFVNDLDKKRGPLPILLYLIQEKVKE